jgi:D-alanine-D-alanine ligase
MKVTVLYGGPSSEREVSIRGGKAVAEALRKAGHDVFTSDISPDDVSGLDRPTDVVFPVLHGFFGEDGQLQEILERRGLAFVGSGSRASKLGMDKVATKMAWQAAGLPTPAWRVVTAADDAQPPIKGPCVVKAIDGGSSIDVHVCKDPAKAASQAREAIRKVVKGHGRALVEQFVQGVELTVGLLEEQPLPALRIVPKNDFYDYESKYAAGGSQHLFDTTLPEEVVDQCWELARKANEIVGARDLARVDIIVDQSHQPYLLEINTLPGFTSTSLLPEAANKAGVPFDKLCDRLVRRAAERARKPRAVNQ